MLYFVTLTEVDQPGIGGLNIKEAEYLSRFGPGKVIFILPIEIQIII